MNANFAQGLRPSSRIEALQGLAGGIPARRPADASPGVRTGAAQEQVFQRGAVLTIPGYRAHDQQLVQRHLTVEDAALGQAVLPLHVERSAGSEKHTSQL